MSNEVKSLLRWVIAGGAALAFIGAVIWGPWIVEGGHVRDRDLAPSAGIIVTGFRTALIAVVAGVVAGLGLWYKDREHRLAQRQFEHTQEQFKLAQEQFVHSQRQFEHAQEKDREQGDISREGQVTERYVEAIKLLGSEKAMERLGGIHSLARIMKDSERDRCVVVDVLCSFVRLRMPVSPQQKLGDLVPEAQADAQIQAAITAIGRRPDVEKVPYSIDLSRVNLSRISFDGLNFDSADFSHSFMDGASVAGANFNNARLIHASLRGLYIESTNLRGAALTGADLGGTTFWNSDLSNTLLVSANLNDARIVATTMKDARLFGANLRGAILFEEFYGMVEQAERISADEISEAFIYETTRLSPDMAKASKVRERIAECEAGGATVQDARGED
ncbi:pentapeptide repeat-containing protein [Streptomyces sp. DSM 41527]|uniref:Pentapeptide repeat-containing protein n=1 Tax=Streptomyces mooreae TaxID=3075523 RepID=A0ABU2TAW6_9ACTN|nr:pentapeptide repeat-containing protein [Streptomyces sp. DSM 41527]MDT0458090.1 pentapeptide repeat-containing protein [Streptomyces sp. DSM 41527]